MSKVRHSNAAIFLGTMILCAACAASVARAQTSETYKVRLTAVAIDASMMVRVTGSGELTAVLTGNKLAITGTFSGLHSAATDAHIHRGVAKGVRGAAILDLHVTPQPPDTTRMNGYRGEIHDAVELTPEQIEDLRNGRLYVQIESEGSPDGNLWGWLLR
jgi:hypothetical protein